MRAGKDWCRIDTRNGQRKNNPLANWLMQLRLGFTCRMDCCAFVIRQGMRVSFAHTLQAVCDYRHVWNRFRRQKQRGLIRGQKGRFRGQNEKV